MSAVQGQGSRKIFIEIGSTLLRLDHAAPPERLRGRPQIFSGRSFLPFAAVFLEIRVL